jgi:uncharacterized RDD family membrane protein YckC
MVSAPEPVLGTEQDVVGARVGAFVVDYIVSLVLGVGLGVGLGLSVGSASVAYLGVLFVLGYFVALEGAFGQTLGKRLFGVVVMTEHSGQPIGYGTSALRNVLQVVDGILSYAVGLVFVLLSDNRQRLGNRAAGTVVVRAK